MSGRTRRLAGAILAGGLAIGGGVALMSTSASGVEPPEATKPVTVPYGTLTISLTDRDGTYELQTASGSTSETIQTVQPCATIEPGTGDLMLLTPNPASPTSSLDTVQIRDSAVGVNTGNTSCGSSAASLLSGDEQLKAELGAYFDALPVNVYIKKAVLQVTQNKKGNLTYGLDDGAQGSAITIDTSPKEVTVEPTINSVDDLFTSITLQSTTRKDNEGVSLADGTYFELVTLSGDFEVAVDCGEKVTEIGGAGDVATKATYLRGQNDTKNGTNTCEDVGVIVEVQTESEAGANDGKGGRVYWDNSFVGVGGTQQRVQGTVTIEWAPVFITGLTQEQIEAILDREIDYDGPNPLAGFTDTLWCLSFTNESLFTLPPYSGPGANTNGTTEVTEEMPDPTVDDTAPWCLVSDTRVLTNVDDPSTEEVDPKPAILQTEVLAGKGDPWRL